MRYSTIKIEGNILSSDILNAIEQGELGGQAPKDFGLDGRVKVKDEIVRAWADARDLWRVFSHRMERTPEDETGASETRKYFTIPFLDLLGYDVTTAKAEDINGKSYAISHRDKNLGGFPVHIMGFRDDLDRRRRKGGPRMSPHALVQEYLNLHEHLYALVTNGLQLRLLRDSSRLVKLSYLEFDLERMFEEDHFSDFAILFRLLHVSRMPVRLGEGDSSLIERYHQDALDSGARIRDGLSNAVRDSIIALGEGFLNHPSNSQLREWVNGNNSKAADNLYTYLLRLVYRLLFLMVIEERNLVFPDDIAQDKRDIYYTYYSIERLRSLSEKYFLYDTNQTDYWTGLCTTFSLFEEDGKGLPLGVQPLAGELFNYRAIGILTDSVLDNHTVLTCIKNLNVFINNKTGQLTRVNYASLSVEEFGSVYEGMLDYHPVIVPRGRQIKFDLVSGKERKTTGSYYTPHELVAELIKSALEPVVYTRLKDSGDPQAELLSIKVCDPAAGSGHFLLAAARYLARELARLRSGEDEPSPRETRHALREVIAHCIYGVDKNPLAVELCKVSLWIEGHEAGKPLSFLDHRIKCGDSLIGVMDIDVIMDEGIPDDAFKAVQADDKSLAAQLKRRNKSFASREQQSLFAVKDSDLTELSKQFKELDLIDDDDLSSRKRKEEAYKNILGHEGLWSREYTICCLWTAPFFTPITEENRKKNRLITNDEFFRYIQTGDLPKNVIAYAQELALDHRFFNWPVEFPEVFEKGGFDCVLGNPPWERIKLQEKEFFAAKDPDIAGAANKSERERLIKQLKDNNPNLLKEFESAKYESSANGRFIRESGRYPLTAVGDINTYAIFAETSRLIISGLGRAGIIVPTGIATDDTCKNFFGDVIEKKSIASLYDFENRKKLFQDVDSRQKFSLLTLSGSEEPVSSFAFFLTQPVQLKDTDRVFSLTPEDIEQINPNTKTCPVFRTSKDAELTKKIYSRVPVLVNERTGENPWGVSFHTMFHMSNDSHLFHVEQSDSRLPLYEAKMFHQFDHRWATYDTNGDIRDLSDEEKSDPNVSINPRYWVENTGVDHFSVKWLYNWFFCYRGICRSTDERSAIFSIIPKSAVSNSAPYLYMDMRNLLSIILLLSNMSSIGFDFITRQKLGGSNFNFFIVKQLPVLSPEMYNELEVSFVIPRALELIYSSWDIKSFADDAWGDSNETLRTLIKQQWENNREITGGHKWQPPGWLEINEDGIPLPPFKWDPERRALLRAELDAYYANLYGLTRDELRYILDPSDVYGEDFPGETFRVLKNNEIRKYGEYRTRRLVLEAWDRLFGG